MTGALRPWPGASFERWNPFCRSVIAGRKNRPRLLIRFTTLSPLSWTAASLHAVGAVGVAMIARYALDPLLGDELPYITLYPAVLFTAIVAGGWAGMGALLLGVAATFWFLSVSPGPAPFSAQTLTGLII